MSLLSSLTLSLDDIDISWFTLLFEISFDKFSTSLLLLFKLLLIMLFSKFSFFIIKSKLILYYLNLINNGIEIPLNPLSNSIKILKKDKHGEVLSNISYSYIFKVSLIGDSSTGKTSILLRFIDDYFTEDTKSTIGVDFKLVSFELEPKIYAKMQIWDTCGSERFKSLTSSFIKTCSAFILIFDLTRKNTFHNIDHWIKIIKENTSPKFMILIGNKSDLINERNIDKEIILDYCEKNLFNYMEISAKNNLNIEKLFKEVAYQLYNDIKKSEKNDIKNIGYKGNFSDIQVKLDDNNPSQKKGCCW